MLAMEKAGRSVATREVNVNNHELSVLTTKKQVIRQPPITLAMAAVCGRTPSTTLLGRFKLVLHVH